MRKDRWRVAPLLPCLSSLLLLTSCGDDTRPNPSPPSLDSGIADSGVNFEPDAEVIDAGVLLDSGTEPDGGFLLPDCERYTLQTAPRGEDNSPVNGTFTVWVTDGTNPLFGATVVAQLADETISGVTDENGCVSLEDPNLVDPMTYHIFAVDHSIESRRAQTFHFQTVSMRSLSPRAPNASGRFEGRIVNLDLVNTATVQMRGAYQLGYVTQLRPRTVSRGPEVGLRPGSPFLDENQVLVGPGTHLDTFAFNAQPGNPLGLGVLAGTASVGVDRLLSLELTHLGYAPTATVGPGEVLTNLELELEVPIDQPVAVSEIGAPYSFFVFEPAVFFPDGSRLEMFRWPIQLPVDWRYPQIIGPLAEANATIGGILMGFNQAQTTFVFRVVRDLGTTSQLVFDDWLAPASTVEVDVRQVTFNDMDTAHFCHCVLFDEQNAIAARFANADPETMGTFDFPKVPDGFIDPFSGPRFMYNWCYRAPEWDPRGEEDIATQVQAWITQIEQIRFQ